MKQQASSPDDKLRPVRCEKPFQHIGWIQVNVGFPPSGIITQHWYIYIFSESFASLLLQSLFSSPVMVTA